MRMFYANQVLRIEFSCMSTIKTEEVLNFDSKCNLNHFMNLALTEPKANIRTLSLIISLMFSRMSK